MTSFEESVNNLTRPMQLSGPISLGQEQQVTLLVYHRRGVEAVGLMDGQPLTLGRSVRADRCIADPSLSRQHARFSLDADQLSVQDLGSTNGTRVNGAAVDSAVLRAGDEVMLGDVSVTFHLLSPTEGRLSGLLGHDRLMALLEEELERHRCFGRGLGLLMIRGPRGTRGHLKRWCPVVQQRLRPVDRLAMYGPTTAELLLPEMTPASLRQVAGQLVDAGAAQGVRLVCGGALFPQAATSAEQLLDAARTATQRASADEPVCLAPAAGKQSLATGPSKVVVSSPAMQRVYAVVERMRRSVIPVLIVGETGTGKEVVARAIHGDESAVLPCVNCGAIPEQLIESTLFGHEKGAFTGADRTTRGLFEEADGGAVLLDEIGELTPAAQAALLRVLDTKRISRVGSTREIEVNVRVLAATHRNLEAMCEAGGFRQDLLYRINTMTIKVPPLRERAEEIEPLALHFLSEANEANGCAVEGLAPAALELLRRHQWPGNVRELRNVMHRAVVMALGPQIEAADLPDRVCSAAAAPAGQLGADALPLDLQGEDVDFKTRIQRYEQQLICAALEQTGGHKTEAAKLLRIPLRTLIYKVKSYGL